MKEYYLGIDIGTYESRGMLIDENMIPVADCSVTHGMDHPQEGWFEHDADKVWWGDFCKLCSAWVIAGLMSYVRNLGRNARPPDLIT